jgi:hypothetical protein
MLRAYGTLAAVGGATVVGWTAMFVSVEGWSRAPLERKFGTDFHKDATPGSAAGGLAGGLMVLATGSIAGNAMLKHLGRWAPTQELHTLLRSPAAQSWTLPEAMRAAGSVGARTLTALTIGVALAALAKPHFEAPFLRPRYDRRRGSVITDRKP